MKRDIDTKVCVICFLIFMGIVSTANVVWQALEILLYGSLRPSTEDGIMCMLMSFAIYKAFRSGWRINGK